ncbi:hypothetical protein [Marinobacter sp. NFXS9]|uniref:hypothetical protein n=1 Tax=Marinobacter sp. NFXS9 TaxID=2818433 RepID=UPI0032DE7597
MKALLLIFLGILSASAYSADLTINTLEGKWRVIPQSDEEASMGEDHWVFREGKFQVYSSGKKVGTADPYRIEGSKIIYGAKPWEVTIKVKSFSNEEMKVNTSGIAQQLEKVE